MTDTDDGGVYTLVSLDTLTRLLDERGVAWELGRGIGVSVLAFTVDGRRVRVQLPRAACTVRAWAEAYATVDKLTTQALAPTQTAADRAVEVISYRGVLVTRQVAYVLEMGLKADKKAARLYSFSKSVRAVDGVPLSLAAARAALAHLFSDRIVTATVTSDDPQMIANI